MTIDSDGATSMASETCEPDDIEASPAGVDLLDRILAQRQIRSVYQPIVDLDSGVTVAYEALARGPRGALERPDLLFATARRAGRVTDLDRACRTAAIAGARQAGLAGDWALFVNIEPAASEHAFRARVDGPGGFEGLRVVVELTERALTADPTQLLQLVGRIRSRGWGIALDDVGADRASLALLPLLKPDVIKLDLRLIQHRPSSDIAEIASAVNAEAERSGTAVLAEGIETDEHLAVALGLGATLGQGWMLGLPGPLPTELPALTGRPVRIDTHRAVAVRHDSPYALAAARAQPRAARKTLLIEISKHLERQAIRSGEATVVLAAFQDAAFFTSPTRKRYARIANTAAFVGALGVRMPTAPMPGVRGGVLEAADPLIGEWDIAVLGPHFAAVLVARDLGDDGPDAERRFEFVLSHDRELAISVATSLMSRISAEQAPTDLAMPATSASNPRRRLTPSVPLTGPPSEVLDQTVAGLLNRALDATRTGIAIADAQLPDMPLIYVNLGFEQITGHSAAHAVSRNCRFLQGPGTDRRSIAEIADAVRRGAALSTRILNYRLDGTPFWNQLELHPVRDEAGTLTHYISVQDDVTARVEAEARVAFLAYHDQLTGLANRAQLLERLEAALDRGRRHATSTAALFIDLDHFKQVNDHHGHGVGDEVLRRVAATLKEATRSSDVLARVGGDEFLLLLADLQPDAAAEVAARVEDQIRRALHSPISLRDLTADGQPVTIGCSIGIAVAGPQDELTAERLISQADAQMYEAKQRSRHPA